MLKRRAKITQIPLAYRSYRDIKHLVNMLKKIGYEIIHGLDDLDNLKENVIAINVDTRDKVVFQMNVTCMAGWCSTFASKPLYVHEAIKYFRKLFIDLDEDFYNTLLESVQSQKGRASGCLFTIKDTFPIK